MSTTDEKYIPLNCDSCRYCKIQHVKKYLETYWKCKLLNYKPCFDKTINNFSVMEHKPSWCPILSQSTVIYGAGQGGNITKRKTMQNDIKKHGAFVDGNIEKLKKSTNVTHVFYGEADYGYFADICSNNPDEVTGMGINTETKAGARALAKRYHVALNVPIKSDWD